MRAGWVLPFHALATAITVGIYDAHSTAIGLGCAVLCALLFVSALVTEATR